MGGFRGLGAKAGIAGELMMFLWQRKRWWLMPIVSVLLITGMLMIFAQGSALAPFIYALF